jgi:hypothetical protein
MSKGDGSMKLFRTALLTGALALSGALSFADTHIYVRVRPPVAVREVRPVAPGAGYYWVPGYHRWDGNAYVWNSGRWEQPPRARARWVHGGWRHTRRGYYWTDGRWR